MNLKDIQALVYVEYKKNGYEKMWGKARKLLKTIGMEGIVDLAEVGLATEEIGEELHEIRKGNDVLEGGEIADVIIRLLNYASRKGIDVEEAILHKHAVNMGRGKLHGKKI